MTLKIGHDKKFAELFLNIRTHRIVNTNIVMAYIVMAYTVMADIASYGIGSNGLYGYDLQ